jgi:alpha-mannosidase
MPDKKITAIMISKTHWDREHSRPFEQFRWHLVYNVMDKLLEIFESTPEYKSFMFDGQSLGILDYLKIRPEKEADIKRYVQEDRLILGPFFVGPDEFIPSGESLIRNLLEGHKVAMKFGSVMKVGYNPDAFGHISQLPQILRGFSIDSAVFSRGMGEDIGKPGVDFIWESPDGSEIIAVYNHYGNAAGLPADPEAALDRIKRTIDSMIPKPVPYVLLSNGSDGSPPQEHIPVIVKYANENLKDVEITHGTLQQYVDMVRSDTSELKRYQGELRYGRYNLILGGVYSARTYLKQENAKTQTLLEKYAEPFAAFAWAVLGDNYPSAFLERAWRLLLQNHFHDTICACSQDKVYHDAMQRYSQSQQISEKLLERSLKVIANAIDTAKPGMPDSTALIVFNPLSHERTEVATKKMYIPVEADGRLQDYIMKDSHGNIISSQIRNQRIREHFQPSFWEKRYPNGKRIREFDISFMAEAVPSCGYKTYYLCPAGGRSDINTDLIAYEMGMENDYLKVDINPNGTINLTDKISDTSYSGLHFFEDVESVCGEYHHYTTPNSQVINSLSQQARVALVESGPICATFRIDMELLLPELLSEDLQGRSDKLVCCPVTTYITLNTKSRRLDFRTVLKNKAKDHRLRVRFPTGVDSDHVHAEGQFHVVKRNIKLPEAIGWVEKPVPESPHQTFVSVSDSDKGLTLINRGLTEYAAEETPNGVILSLTLLRGVGWIGREFFVTATYKIPTPEAQCLGEQEFEYSICPHKGTWEESGAWQLAHNFNAPLKIVDAPIHSGNLPASFSLFSIEPKELIVTAIKKAEDDNSLVIRFYNTSDRQITGRISVFRELKKVTVTNLLEELLEDIPVSKDRIVISVRKHQIVTLKLDFIC